MGVFALTQPEYPLCWYACGGEVFSRSQRYWTITLLNVSKHQPKFANTTQRGCVVAAIRFLRYQAGQSETNRDWRLRVVLTRWELGIRVDREQRDPPAGRRRKCAFVAGAQVLGMGRQRDPACVGLGV